jgi:hypothetical protein
MLAQVSKTDAVFVIMVSSNMWGITMRGLFATHNEMGVRVQNGLDRLGIRFHHR